MALWPVQAKALSASPWGFCGPTGIYCGDCWLDLTTRSTIASFNPPNDLFRAGKLRNDDLVAPERVPPPCTALWCVRGSLDAFNGLDRCFPETVDEAANVWGYQTDAISQSKSGSRKGKLPSTYITLIDTQICSSTWYRHRFIRTNFSWGIEKRQTCTLA